MVILCAQPAKLIGFRSRFVDALVDLADIGAHLSISSLYIIMSLRTKPGEANITVVVVGNTPYFWSSFLVKNKVKRYW